MLYPIDDLGRFVFRQSRSWMDRSLHLANEKGFETARTVVPLQSLSIPIPQLEAVFFLAVLVSVTKCIHGVFFLYLILDQLNFSNGIFYYTRSRKIVSFKGRVGKMAIFLIA